VTGLLEIFRTYYSKVFEEHYQFYTNRQELVRQLIDQDCKEDRALAARINDILEHIPKKTVPMYSLQGMMQGPLMHSMTMLTGIEQLLRAMKREVSMLGFTVSSPTVEPTDYDTIKSEIDAQRAVKAMRDHISDILHKNGALRGNWTEVLRFSQKVKGLEWDDVIKEHLKLMRGHTFNSVRRSTMSSSSDGELEDTEVMEGVEVHLLNDRLLLTVAVDGAHEVQHCIQHRHVQEASVEFLHDGVDQKMGLMVKLQHMHEGSQQFHFWHDDPEVCDDWAEVLREWFEAAAEYNSTRLAVCTSQQRLHELHMAPP